MYIGIDLGGTNIAVGCVDDSGKLLAKSSTSTLPERGYKAIVKDMAGLCGKVAKQAGVQMYDIKAIGLGSPGTIDSENGIVVFAGNLNMEKTPLADELKKYFDIPVHMENDANAAAYGEYAVCGLDVDNMILITLGTGVGSGIIVNKRIYRGFNNAGGEIGHMTIEMNGIKCTCGKRGCFECYASIIALKRQTKAMMDKYPDSMMIDWVNKKGRITGRTAFECALKGDIAATKVRNQYIRYIAEGIVNVVNIFQPELVLVGGGISAEGDVILKPLKEFVYKYDFNKFMPKTDIRTAKLFNDAGIVGAAMAARDNVKYSKQRKKGS